MQMNGSATVKMTKPITATRGCGKEIAIRVIRCKPVIGGRFREVFTLSTRRGWHLRHLGAVKKSRLSSERASGRVGTE